jgi:hypothetical protein
MGEDSSIVPSEVSILIVVYLLYMLHDSIKARILDEFERSKLKANMDSNNSSGRSKERLRQRREKRSARDGEGKRRGDDDEMAFIAEIMGEAVDGLLDETTDVTLSSVLSVSDQSGSSRKSKKGSSYRSLEDVTEKDLLLSKERGHQKELVR